MISAKRIINVTLSSVAILTLGFSGVAEAHDQFLDEHHGHHHGDSTFKKVRKLDALKRYDDSHHFYDNGHHFHNDNRRVYRSRRLRNGSRFRRRRIRRGFQGRFGVFF